MCVCVCMWVGVCMCVCMGVCKNVVVCLIYNMCNHVKYLYEIVKKLDKETYSGIFRDKTMDDILPNYIKQINYFVD